IAPCCSVNAAFLFAEPRVLVVEDAPNLTPRFQFLFATPKPRDRGVIPQRGCRLGSLSSQWLRRRRRVQRRNGSHEPLNSREAFAPLDAALLVAARRVLPR